MIIKQFLKYDDIKNDKLFEQQIYFFYYYQKQLLNEIIIFFQNYFL